MFQLIILYVSSCFDVSQYLSRLINLLTLFENNIKFIIQIVSDFFLETIFCKILKKIKDRVAGSRKPNFIIINYLMLVLLMYALMFSFRK